MKKDYNRDVMSDMPIDASFTPAVQTKTTKTTAPKPKINAIGTQKRTTNSTKTTKTTKSSTSKPSSKTTKSKTLTSKTDKTEKIDEGLKTQAKSTAKNPTTKSSSTKAKEIKKDEEKKSATSAEPKEKKLRTKLINSNEELTDLEKLNEENIKSYRFKSKRNRVIIAILAFLLVLTIATIVTIVVISKLKTNCNMYIHGNVNAAYVIDGQQIDEFRTPSNLQGNRRLELDIKIKIRTDEYYNIKFTPECYQKGVLMQNTLIYEYNQELFYDGGDGYYYSKQPIRGGQTITLCGGVILDYYYQDTLNVDNFRLDFHTYFEKV